MPIIEILSFSQLQRLTSDPNLIVVIDFYAVWCGPCQEVAPHFASLSDCPASSFFNTTDAHTPPPVKVVFCKVNVDNNRDIAHHYGVNSMPTFMIIHNENVENTIVGGDIVCVESYVRRLALYLAAKSERGDISINPVPSSANSSQISQRGPVISPLGRELLNIQAALSLDTTVNCNVQCSKNNTQDVATPYLKEVWRILEEESNAATGRPGGPPIGLSLVSYILSDSLFNVRVLDEVLSFKMNLGSTYISTTPDDDDDHGGESCGTSLYLAPENVRLVVSVVHTLVRYGIHALTRENWNIHGDRSSSSHSSQGGRFHKFFLRLLRVDIVSRILLSPGTVGYDETCSYCPTHTMAIKTTTSMKVLAAMTPSPLFIPPYCISHDGIAGYKMQRLSFLGSLLSPGLFSRRDKSFMGEDMWLNRLFMQSRPTLEGTFGNPIEEANIRSQIQMNLLLNVERAFPVFREMLGRKTYDCRRMTLLWIAQFLSSNSGHAKEMRDVSSLCSHTAILTLTYVLVELALPVVNATGFESGISPQYLLDMNEDAPNASEINCDYLLQMFEKEDRTTEEGVEEYIGVRCRASENSLTKGDLDRLLNQRALVFFASQKKEVERIELFHIPSVDEANKTATDDFDDKIDRERKILPLVPSSFARPSNFDELCTSVFDRETKSSLCSDIPGAVVKRVLPVVGPNRYPPKVHLFFFAIRAVSLSQTAMLLHLDSWKRSLRHPNVEGTQKQFIAIKVSVTSSLLSCPDVARKTVQFMNGVARWLLHILKVDPYGPGTLPEEVPLQWQYLPQQIIDDVFRSTKLITLLKLSVIEPSDIRDIVSLLLLLMGNTKYFPKVHTHALFPGLVVDLLNHSKLSAALMEHQWFQKNIVIRLVHTYIAMEHCTYERVECRYLVCQCLRVLLKQEILCFEAREILERADNGVLEHFAHMLTSESNSAMDEALESLEKMKKKELEGKDTEESGVSSNGGSLGTHTDRHAANRTRGSVNNSNNNSGVQRSDGDDDEVEANNEDEELTYPQLGSMLQNSLYLFQVSIDVFKALSERFPSGVLQNMVAQQISNMLTRSLVKLAGPNSKELKINNPDKYNFNPRELLGNIVECLVTFRGEPSFIRHLCASATAAAPPAGESFYFALDNILNPNRPLVFGTLANDLRLMQQSIRDASVEVQAEEDLWGDDPPEFALCALMSVPLKNPMALPTTGEDLIFVESDVIHHALLSKQQNPFAREPLTNEELDAFNKTPRVEAAVKELKAKIAAYLDERRNEFQKSK